ncbi:hypothetical protein F5Y11DRAFT_346029 [Daldinia sp. FL1419]|nr:hypothetical protein F5Y11DRAFT_346029 [Daldinia sp. FL1419]
MSQPYNSFFSEDTGDEADPASFDLDTFHRVSHILENSGLSNRTKSLILARAGTLLQSGDITVNRPASTSAYSGPIALAAPAESDSESLTAALTQYTSYTQFVVNIFSWAVERVRTAAQNLYTRERARPRNDYRGMGARYEALLDDLARLTTDLDLQRDPERFAREQANLNERIQRMDEDVRRWHEELAHAEQNMENLRDLEAFLDNLQDFDIWEDESAQTEPEPDDDYNDPWEVDVMQGSY